MASLLRPGIFEGALLEAVVLHQVRLVPLHEPAVLAGHLVKLGAGIRRGEADLHAEDVQLLREADGLLDGLLRLDRQAEDEGAVNDHAGLVAGLGEAAHLVEGDAFLDVPENLLVAALVADQEQPQAGILERLDGVVVQVGAAVAAPGQAERRELLGDLAGARQVGGEGVVVEEELPAPAGRASSCRPFRRRRSAGSGRGICARRWSAARGRRCIGRGSRGRCRGSRRDGAGSR